jgi:uncharacterized protein (TIGR01777 family)
MRVVVTGATGFVGKRVVNQLLENNVEVVILTRNIAKAALTLGSQCKYFQWLNTLEKPPVEAFQGVDGIINLMGEGIADKRWDEAQKKKIYESRIISTQKLVDVLKELPVKPKVMVSTSAVGIYGDRQDEEISEDSNVGSDFLAGVCKDWETEANKASDLGIRVAIIRTGVVLGRNGGALQKMLPIFKLGAGGPVGNGRQYMSWIHIDDLASMYVEALKNDSIKGPLNGTAPYPATSKEFAKTLGKTLHRPAFAPAPTFAIKLAFGEMSDVLLKGQKVLPQKFKEKKFRYRYPTLEMALKETAF